MSGIYCFCSVSYYVAPNEVSGRHIVILCFFIKSPTTKCRETYCFCPVSYYYIPDHEVSGIYCFCTVSYFSFFYYIPDHEVSGIYCFCSVSYYSFYSFSPSSSFTWTCPYRFGKVFKDRKLKLGMSIDHVLEGGCDPFWWKNSSPMGGFRGLKVGVVFVKNKYKINIQKIITTMWLGGFSLDVIQK